MQRISCILASRAALSAFFAVKYRVALCALLVVTGAASAQDSQLQQQAQVEPQAGQQAEAAPAEADLVVVREQLDQLLSDAGLPVGDERDATAARIEALAQRSNTISQQATSPRAKLEASNLELRSYNALAQEAYRNDFPEEASLRQRQMRDVAAQAKAIPEPAAETVGDFWLLQADLMELNNARPDEASQRQREAITLLERFVTARQQAGDAVEFDDAARKIATDVRLSLLRLYDDRGDSVKACATVNHLRAQADATDDAALREQLARWYGYCPVLGQRFEATLPTRDGGVWRSADAQGNPVLLHLWASWWPASWPSFETLTAEHARIAERGVTLVSIDLGPPPPAKLKQQASGRGPAADEAEWTQCRQPAGVMDLQALFHIRALPRYVLLDAQGHVQALGGSLAILEQVPQSPTPATTTDPAPPAMQEAEPTEPAVPAP